MYMSVHDPICQECMGPGYKDHLALMTAFACTVGWSFKPGFTVSTLYFECVLVIVNAEKKIIDEIFAFGDVSYIQFGKVI